RDVFVEERVELVVAASQGDGVVGIGVRRGLGPSAFWSRSVLNAFDEGHVHLEITKIASALGNLKRVADLHALSNVRPSWTDLLLGDFGSLRRRECLRRQIDRSLPNDRTIRGERCDRSRGRGRDMVSQVDDVIPKKNR